VISSAGDSGGSEGRWIGCVSSAGTGARGGCTDATEETRENLGRADPVCPGSAGAGETSVARDSSVADTGAAATAAVANAVERACEDGATADERREVGVVEAEGGRGTSAGLTPAGAAKAEPPWATGLRCCAPSAPAWWRPSSSAELSVRRKEAADAARADGADDGRDDGDGVDAPDSAERDAGGRDGVAKLVSAAVGRINSPTS
jgi:hypothetical protein